MEPLHGRRFVGAHIGLIFAAGLIFGPPPLSAGQLHDAVRARNVAEIERLVSIGAGVDESDFMLGTPLHVAIAQGDMEIALLLIDSGADLEAESELQGARSLHLAVELGEVAIVKALLERGAVVDSRDSRGATPLFRASAAGRSKAVRLLLDHGANPGLRDRSTAATPLHKAAENGHLEVAALLVERGALIDAADSIGYTPLWWASAPPSFRKVGDGSLIEFLVSHGADLEARDNAGFTPLEYVTARRGYDAWRPIEEVLQRLSSRK